MFCDWLVSVLAVGGLCGCGGRSCPDLIEREDYRAAAPACARAFASDDDHNAGISAAQAYRHVQRDDDALVLAAQLLAGPRGADARRPMAAIYLEQQNFAAARSLLEHALRLDRRSGDHVVAHNDAAAPMTEYWKRSAFR